MMGTPKSYFLLMIKGVIKQPFTARDAYEICLQTRLRNCPTVNEWSQYLRCTPMVRRVGKEMRLTPAGAKKPTVLYRFRTNEPLEVTE
jgi:hypothetical protein